MSHTSAKSWHAPRDAFIDEKRFRFSDAPGFFSDALGKDPEFCVDKGPGGNRISKSLL